MADQSSQLQHLNSRVRDQQRQLLESEQKCVAMEEQLRRQESIAMDRKSQMDGLRRRVTDLDFLKASSGRLTGCSTIGHSQEEAENHHHPQDERLSDVLRKVKEEMSKMREEFSAELTEQSEKHLERERHLSEQILSYQTEMATHKDMKGSLQREILELKSMQEQLSKTLEEKDSLLKNVTDEKEKLEEELEQKNEEAAPKQQAKGEKNGAPRAAATTPGGIR